MPKVLAGIVVLASALVVALTLAAAAGAASAPGPPAADAQAFHLLLAQLPSDYVSADRTHDAVVAARLRAEVGALHTRAQADAARAGASAPALARAAGELAQLERVLGPTSVRLQPWPLVSNVDARATRMRVSLDSALRPALAAPRPYTQIEAALQSASGAAARGRSADAVFELAFARALYEQGPGARLERLDSAVAQDASLSWEQAQARPASASVAAVQEEVRRVQATLGEQSLSRVTIVSDAAIIVFREGLEAALDRRGHHGLVRRCAQAPAPAGLHRRGGGSGRLGPDLGRRADDRAHVQRRWAAPAGDDRAARHRRAAARDQLVLPPRLLERLDLPLQPPAQEPAS